MTAKPNDEKQMTNHNKHNINTQSIYLRIVIISLFLLIPFLFSCSSTKYVPEKQFLLNKVKIKCDNKDINKEELRTYLKQKPNRRLIGLFKFHLGVYNFSNAGKETKLKKWLKEVVGEEPVILDDYLVGKTKSQFIQYLKNKSYYNAIIKDSISYKKKKAVVHYDIKTNKPYIINKLNYNIKDLALDSIILSDTANSLLKKNVLFDIDILQNERSRLTHKLKDEGFFTFSKDYINYVVDSSSKDNKLNVLLEVNKNIRKVSENFNVKESHNKYKIQNIYIYSDFEPGRALKEGDDYYKSLDTTYYNGFYFIYHNNLKIKPSVILQSNLIHKGDYYNLTDVEKTYKYLFSLNIFRIINISYKEIGADENNQQLLNCYIQLTPYTTQSYSVELEGTNTSGNVGVAGNINYKHKNLFKGAEIFDLKFKGALQFQQAVVENQSNQLMFNTVEFGTEAKIDIPKFFLPFKFESFYMKYYPKTLLSLSYNYQKRPDYTRSIANFGFGYYWKSSKFIKQVVKPVDINFVKIPYITTEFDSLITGTYLENSYKNFFIPEASYSFVYNNQSLKKHRDFVFFRTNFESSGNSLYGIYNLFSEPKNNEVSYELLDLPFSQFVRADFDFRYYNVLNKNSTLVYRSYVGFGLPYGNSKVLPFVKQFYSGGANGIRAWQVRSLGPGSYEVPPIVIGGDTIKAYPNQSADFKLEANFEYRFDLFWILQGAFFVDAGNIWAVNQNDKREGALFKFNKFYKDIAIGTGLGLRFDFSFFLLRFDLGVKARDPIEPLNNGWILGHRKIKYDDWTFNIAIGYPF